MSEQPVSSDPISTYLDRNGLVHTVQDGVHVVPFGPPGADPDDPPNVVLLVWSGAEAAGGLMVEMHTAPLVAAEDMEAVLHRCNEWNRRSRATKARIDEVPERRVVIEAWMPWSEGLAEDHLSAFLDLAVGDMLSSVQVSAGAGTDGPDS